MGKNIHAGINKLHGFGVNMFTDDELYTMHLATLEILRDVGIGITDPDAQEALAGVGCIVDKKNGVVHFPNYVVEEAIRLAPKTINWAGRNPAKTYVLEDNRTGFTNFGEGIMVYDLYDNEYRRSTKKDCGQAALMADALDAIDVHERAVSAQDVPAAVAPLHEVQVNITNTSKHLIQGCGTVSNLRKIYKVMCHIAGGEEAYRANPIYSTITCPISPLQLVPESTAMIMESARLGVPIVIISMALAGGTTPVTLAGTLLTHNCEALASVVLSQATVKGAPVIYGSSTSIMDLKYTCSPVGCPELGMINASVAKLAQFYGIPSWVAGG